MDAFEFSESGYWLEPDFVLIDIVTTLVNLMGIPVGMTLFLKGMVISGILVSEKEYLEGLTNVFNQVAKESLQPTDEAAWQEVESLFDFRHLSESPEPPDPDQDIDEDDLELRDPVRYLHIRDVVIVTPQPSISFGQSLMPIMRISLTAIDGWLLGQAMPMDVDEEDGPPPLLH